MPAPEYGLRARLDRAQERLNRARSLLEQSMSEMTVRESKIWAAETNALLSECRDDDGYGPAGRGWSGYSAG